MSQDHLTRARFRTAAIATVLLASVAVYLPALDNVLLYDDGVLVGRDRRVVEPGHLGEIWTSDYWPGDRPSFNYRPLTTTSYALVQRLSGNQRGPNLVLHGLCSVLVLLLAAELGLKRWGALFAGGLFAVHPIHSEALFLAVGRGELLAGLFGLTFMLGVLRRWPLVVLAPLLAAALLSKESAVVAPALALLLWRARSPDEPWPTLTRRVGLVALSAAPALLLLFVLRYRIYGVLLTPPGHVDPLYNPLADLTLGPRLAGALWVQLLYLKAMIWPFPLSADYSCCQISLPGSLWGLRGIVGLALPAAALTLLAWRRSRWTPETVGLLVCLVALLPTSNLIFTTGVMFGERLAYLPALGLCLAAGSLLQRILERCELSWQRGVALGAAGLLLLGSAWTVLRRDADWQDEESFTRALVRDVARSALAHNLRFLHLRDRQPTLAERHLREAVRLYPGYYQAWNALGEVLERQGKHGEAVAAHVRAARVVARRPRDAGRAGGFWLAAAALQLRTGDCRGARRSVAEARRWLPEGQERLRVLRQQLQRCASRPRE